MGANWRTDENFGPRALLCGVHLFYALYSPLSIVFVPFLNATGIPASVSSSEATFRSLSRTQAESARPAKSAASSNALFSSVLRRSCRSSALRLREPLLRLLCPLVMTQLYLKCSDKSTTKLQLSLHCYYTTASRPNCLAVVYHGPPPTKSPRTR
jgi:hypothetical protein